MNKHGWCSSSNPCVKKCYVKCRGPRGVTGPTGPSSTGPQNAITVRNEPGNSQNITPGSIVNAQYSTVDLLDGPFVFNGTDIITITENGRYHFNSQTQLGIEYDGSPQSFSGSLDFFVDGNIVAAAALGKEFIDTENYFNSATLVQTLDITNAPVDVRQEIVIPPSADGATQSTSVLTIFRLTGSQGPTGPAGVGPGPTGPTGPAGLGSSVSLSNTGTSQSLPLGPTITTLEYNVVKTVSNPPFNFNGTDTVTISSNGLYFVSGDVSIVIDFSSPQTSAQNFFYLNVDGTIVDEAPVGIEYVENSINTLFAGISTIIDVSSAPVDITLSVQPNNQPGTDSAFASRARLTIIQLSS